MNRPVADQDHPGTDPPPSVQVLGVVMRPDRPTVDDRIRMRGWLKALAVLGFLISPVIIVTVLSLNSLLDWAGTLFIE